MGELAKIDGGESGVHTKVVADVPSSSSSDHMSEKFTDSSDDEQSKGPARTITGLKWILVVTAILSSHMLFALDNTIVANIQPAIVEQYQEAQKISWLSVAFPLCSSALVLPWSKAYATYNAKWLYIGCVVLFMAGSALCGAAPDMDSMIVGRAMAGAGGSGMYFGVLTLLSVNTTVSERPFYIGLTAVSWGIGTVTGPAIGGAFAESSATWRWAFYINLVIGGAFAPVYAFMLPSFEPLPKATQLEKAKNIDWVGSVLFVGALATLIMAIDFGGAEWAWDSARSIALFVVAGVLFIIFGVQQTFYIFCNEQNRLFPIHFFKRRSLVLLFILNTCASSGLFISVYYIPLFFQFTQGDTAVKASLRLLPFVLVLIFTIILNGHMMSKLGYYMPWYLLGSAFELIAAALMYVVKPDTSASAIYGYTALMALGVGAFNQAGYSVVQAKVKPSEIPWALGFMMVSQLGGIVLALGMAGAIFVNKATAGLLELLPDVDPEIVKNAIAGTSSSLFKSLSDEVQAKALGVIVHAIDLVYVLLIVAGAMGVLLSVFLKREKLFLEMAAGGA
ncbi:putative MFS drug efflux transporter [Aspergillus clavatus NRRL 1]|uniref:MFS drug efflux transporter, putative n=1 Tax=Aspergillus clavatus (strain ATCC 1007 / CBS 513.65 / DSM 816 / NCTC 3887 / NRRL 1 / QM 1276 / 107) TaxID=344612 RepID=A1C8T5_ASPCL|nr:MFS drug efflux transporter, putative [Aspergillus clavatus NRRL 1]EAW13722.1 MFS drug efflux transporter, putative [Aspergillus clavatus NRRL 1]